MALKIDKKIIGFKVIKTEKKNNIISMDEKLLRPQMLFGSTYKIKTPQSEHALYITINDMVLNRDTEHEERRPYEVFINSKNMEHFQWVLALTRVISSVFRKGGDITFMVDELKAVFDPKGGYFKKGGIYMPSLVAEIGYAIEQHLQQIGMLKVNKLDTRQQQFIADKRQQFEAKYAEKPDTDANFPEQAQLCVKCYAKASVLIDGCMTCLNCGDSKCS